MVHIKRVELTNFKSFGGTTSVPLLPGCTVISGPNGSGKSNILDALLFCLGLSSSKGMRAERLPDLVNNTQTAKGRASIEASVTVTFDLSDEISHKDTKTQRQEVEEVGEVGEGEGEGKAGNGEDAGHEEVREREEEEEEVGEAEEEEEEEEEGVDPRLLLDEDIMGD